MSAYMRCRSLGSVERTVHVISTWPDSMLRINLVTRNLMGSGEYRSAQKVFDELPNRDVVTWNTMIGGLVKNGKFEEAICKFRDMMGKKAEPDKFMFASVFMACTLIRVSSRAFWVHKLMIAKRIAANFILNAALIDMYSRCGKIKIAREIFDNITLKDVSVWNAMFNGLAIHGLSQDATALFSTMEAEYVSPDTITFVSVLTACGCCGLVNEGGQYFHMMRIQYSIEPELEHCGAMVHLLAQTGLLNEAYATINTMPMEPDAIIWRVLLSSSRLFRRSDLGEVAIRNIRSHHSGDYVMLLNTYCSLNRWDRAERLRNLMNRKGIRKLRQKLGQDGRHGSSFYSRGYVAPRNKGNLPSVGQTRLEDPIGGVRSCDRPGDDGRFRGRKGGEAERSEKLAMAYGVLKLSHGSKIMVLKNLRICDDCHRWIKLVSKLSLRGILVRDQLRFHQFEGGSCSCGDY